LEADLLECEEDEMLRSLYRTPEGTIRTDLSQEAFATVLKEPDTLSLGGQQPDE
jgi:hypothetical protein